MAENEKSAPEVSADEGTPQEPISLAANPLSLLGFFLVAVGLLLILTFLVFSFVVRVQNPYLDIVGYLILPSVFVTGLVLVPIGMLLKLWWVHPKRTGRRVTARLPHIDLNNPRTLRGILGFLAFSIFIVLPVVAVSSYEGYLYTESTEFCGYACHSVMKPEATAHATSPHARVTCAECHIGEGASWFVKSKISGVRQVFAVWFNTYSRPIPPAITELRPARDTCEECHWPEKFYGDRYREAVHFSPDENNTRRIVRMRVKVGGADPSIGRVEGIHMHMIMYGHVEYVATDDALQEIPWVRYVTPDGEAHVYRSDGKPYDAPPPDGIRRTVDCMDCHNRGAHHFRSPQSATDLFLDTGWIDPSLPFAKREAVDVLLEDYPDQATADEKIGTRLRDFYRLQYPDVWEGRRAAIDRMVDAVREIYNRNFFPMMKTDWKAFPENVGHMIDPGCFRCHDGLHVDEQGKAITSACDVCHTFQNPVDDNPGLLREGTFQHTMPLTGHQTLRCDACHNGGKLRLCRDCHGSGEWLAQRGAASFRPMGMFPPTSQPAPPIPE